MGTGNINDVIHFLLTGGSIDSHIEPPTNEVVPRADSIIKAYFARYNLLPDAVYTQLCTKDSRSITKNDRERMLETIVESPHRLFIVTHGLATLEETAGYLARGIRDERKGAAIVLTGSALPIEDMAFSDAGIQLGYAVAQVRNFGTGAKESAGVYICLNLETKQFISTSGR